MARVYVNTGWSVFPVWWAVDGICACPAGSACPSPAKHPLTAHGVHSASADPAQVEFWWDTCWPRANIGVPAGANGLAVLDVDAAYGGLASYAELAAKLAGQGAPLPATTTATTGGGGMHLYFAASGAGVKSLSKLPFGSSLPGLDTRGRGGYVVAPPSRHASGRMYEWVNFLDEPAPWPAELDAFMMFVAEGPHE